MQSTAKRLLASLHTLFSGAMPPGAKLLHNAILPEKVPVPGVVILRDGDPQPPEAWLSPPSYFFEHWAEIEVVVDGTPAAHDATFDALRLAIGTALTACWANCVTTSRPKPRNRCCWRSTAKRGWVCCCTCMLFDHAILWANDCSGLDAAVRRHGKRRLASLSSHRRTRPRGVVRQRCAKVHS